MCVDVSKAALSRFPEFDRDRFQTFSDDELRAFEQRMAAACCPDDNDSITPALAFESRRHYTQPAWWKSREQGAAGGNAVTGGNATGGNGS